jgi:hypothetical protein
MGKKRRGRPKKKAGERQATTITVRVTTAERKQFGATAKKSGQKLSEWIRLSLLAAVKTGKIRFPHRKVEESNPSAADTSGP